MVLPPFKIAIVEDEMLSAIVLKHFLEEVGYVVSGIVSSENALLSLVATEKPHLILMDANLFGKRVGVQYAQTVFERFSIPSILISGYPEQDALKNSYPSGVVAYHAKPYQKERLKKQIQDCLDHAQETPVSKNG